MRAMNMLGKAEEKVSNYKIKVTAPTPGIEPGPPG